jgi:hypothetical protein
MPEIDGIACNASFYSARKTQDGGWRVTFDVPKSEAIQVMQISNLDGMNVKMVVIPDHGGEFDGASLS